ncbi:MAG: hypothetical protein K6T85_15180, partial [Gorillibacterium sp.]|nr:hypothetical protein [Gorillibacterium sp.]
MRAKKIVQLTVLSTLIAVALPGCWDYKEINDLMIVAGVAIDKNEKNDNLELTIEAVQIEGSKNSAPKSQTNSLTGNNMFGVVRSMISLTGQRLYWSHAKTIIISEQLAREGMTGVIDWYTRDTETRSDVNMYISTAKTAKEIFASQSSSNKIISFEMDHLMRIEGALSTAPDIQIWDFVDLLGSEGSACIVPTVYLKEEKDKSKIRVSGLAIFR